MLPDGDLVENHMHDVRVVPYRFSRQYFATNLYAVDIVASEPVEPDQWASVVSKLREVASGTRAASGIRLHGREH